MFNKNLPKSLLDGILYEFPKKNDERGSLSFVETKDFTFERAFWIYDVPENAERGGHAHRTCAELLVAVHGSFDLELNDGQNAINVHVDDPAKGVIIRPMVWCRLYNFTEGAVALCLASQEYIPEGYINSFEEFTKAK